MVDPEKLYAALDLIAKGIVQPAKVAKVLGMPYRTYRSWLVRSNSGDEKFLIEVDGETMQWAAAIVRMRRLAMLELRGMLEQYSIYGREEIVFKDGQVVWALDPVAAAMTEDEREALGFRRDALKTGPNGKLVPVMQHHLAPIQLQLRLLEATFKDMRPQSVQEVNVNGNVAVGIAYAGRQDFSKGPPQISPEPEMPQLEVLGDVARDDDLEDLLGPEPVAAPINITIAPQITIAEPEPEIREVDRIRADRTRDLAAAAGQFHTGARTEEHSTSLACGVGTAASTHGTTRQIE
jgi:hypothetical protein